MPGASAPDASLLCVDAFADAPFRGNPAAVCLLDADDARVGDEAWMQSLAAEMNLSETAYVVPRGAHGFDLRWFTPTTEVPLCGHATLASAHALWDTGRLAADEPARFHTRRSGELRASRVDGLIALDLPATPSVAIDVPAGLADALGCDIVGVWRNDLHHLVEVADAATVRRLTPDIDALRAVDVRAVAVTAAGDDPDYDFVSRFFAPRQGIHEDPVTGSAHTSLGPWWGERLTKVDLVGHQVSARGGVVHVHAEPGGPRVTVAGAAVTVWRGSLA